MQAPVPAEIIEKGIPTAGLLAQVLVVKYADHLPKFVGNRSWEFRNPASFFRAEAPIMDMSALVSAVFGAATTPVAPPQYQTFDTRRPENILVEEFGDVVVVSNFDLVWNLLARPSDAEPSIWAALGSPEQWMAFCYMDSGGTYGYAMYEGDRLTRSRLQTTGLPNVAPLVECGEPTSLERKWLDAPWTMEADDPEDPGDQVKVFRHPDTGAETTEQYMTARILTDLSTQLGGVCPWEWPTRPRMHYFQVVLPRA